ncbi:MAG TPA: hypothetical protein VKA84_13295 [Gemmatimonadaceae bacterium]|nr:hypothetical protein [Gemmatimonadaceae bacterium]
MSPLSSGATAALAAAVALAALAVGAARAAAQQRPTPAPAADSATMSGARTVPGLRKQALSLSRSSVMFDPGSTLEFERRVSRCFSLAFGVSGWRGQEYVGTRSDFLPSSGDPGQHIAYDTRELTLRFYPGGQPLNGFSVALTGGHVDARGELWDQPRTRDGVTINGGLVRGPLVGTEAGYSWLLGDRRNLLLNTGLGMRHLFVPASAENVRRTLLTLRLGLGFAF